MPGKALSFASLCDSLRGLKSVLIAAHISPDADAIGSICAMQRGLSSLGIAAEVYLSDPVPERLKSLTVGVPFTNQVPKIQIPALVALDTASFTRLGPEHQQLLDCASSVFNIDHHASNELWGSINYVRSDAPAAAVIVLEILESLSADIDQQSANLLFAGLSDDTGSFRFSNATEVAFAAAGRLLKLGAEPEKVANSLYFSLAESTIRLRARAVEGMKLIAGGKVALVSISQQQLGETGSQAEDTDGIVEIARSCQGVVGAVFLRQITSSGWKASLRSKSSTLDVNAVASSFGGGGHVAAAGCKLDGSLVEVEQLIEAELLKHI